jgi:hypothetical protein
MAFVAFFGRDRQQRMIDLNLASFLATAPFADYCGAEFAQETYRACVFTAFS